jgi:predicted Rossmann fold flavoprotein
MRQEIHPGLTVVVGGGAAGICAAISAARSGQRVVICERTSQIGKKILATGNGRCNLLNDDLSELHYNQAAHPLVRSVFQAFGKPEILQFFEELGLRTYSQDGRRFPFTNQAASVLKVLQLELKRLSVPVQYDFRCSAISSSGDTIAVTSDSGKKIECGRVILTGGGKSYPALGSDGSMYGVASDLGHSIVRPVPSAVPVVVKDRLCQTLQGQRVQAVVRSSIAGREGSERRGELLFTKYGLSGTCVLDASGPVSIAINRDGRSNVVLSVDLVPFMKREELAFELDRRTKQDTSPEDVLAGILPNKFGPALRSLFEAGDSAGAATAIKEMRFKVSGTRGWNEAEFTAGGVNVDEVVLGTLESRLRKGVYFAGEVLDVDGERGGYNLAWAWASGWVAGLGK